MQKIAQKWVIRILDHDHLDLIEFRYITFIDKYSYNAKDM